MHPIETLLKAASRRLHMEAFAQSLHQVLMAAGGLLLALALIDKTTTAFSVPWWWVGFGVGIVGLGAALLIWSTHRRSLVQIAIAVDDKLELREKLSTALHLKGRDDAFARAAVEDAVAVASEARTLEQVRRHFRVRGPRRWYIGPALLLLTLLCANVLPQGDWFARGRHAPASAALPTEVRQVLQSAVEQAKQANLDDEELAKLLEELDPDSFDANALKSPEDARREALKRLTSLQDRMQDILQSSDAKKMDMLEKQLKQLQSFENGPAKELADALSRGDMQAAQEALKELAEQAMSGALPPEQAEQLQQQLESLCEQLQQLAEQKNDLERALQQAGLDRNLAQNPEALKQALENSQNLTEQQKQQLQQAAEASQMSSRMCQSMGNALGQMAAAMGQAGQQDGQQMADGARQASEMLSQLEAMQQMLREAQAMCDSLGGMCQGLGQGLGQGLAQSQGQGGAFGGYGQGAGGMAPRSATPTRTRMEKADTQSGNADVIASMLFDGPQIKGESHAAFQEAIRSAERSFAENVDENQVPRQYHDVIKHFYGEGGLGGKTRSSGDDKSDDKGGESGGTSGDGG